MGERGVGKLENLVVHLEESKAGGRGGVCWGCKGSCERREGRGGNGEEAAAAGEGAEQEGGLRGRVRRKAEVAEVSKRRRARPRMGA
ncbi:hypothetical protein Tco_1410567 [Tanacetum coccineum]